MKTIYFFYWLFKFAGSCLREQARLLFFYSYEALQTHKISLFSSSGAKWGLLGETYHLLGAKDEARLYLLIIYWTADKLMSANLPTGLVGNVQEKEQAPHQYKKRKTSYTEWGA